MLANRRTFQNSLTSVRQGRGVVGDYACLTTINLRFKWLKGADTLDFDPATDKGHSTAKILASDLGGEIREGQ